MKSRDLHILSHSFPNKFHPYDATFVKDHAKVLSGDFQIDVIVPTPYSFPFTLRWHKNNSELLSSKKISAERFNYISIPNKRFPQLTRSSLSKRALKYYREKTPDLMHIHFLYPSGMMIPTLKKRLGIPIVLTIHGVDFYDTITNSKLRKILGDSLKAADAIIAVGPGLHNDIVGTFPNIKNKLQIIYNFVHTEIFKPVNEQEKKELRINLGIDNSAYQLLCVANFRFKKGLDVLVEALHRLKNRTDIELHLLGRLHEEPDFQKQVEYQIKTYQLDNIYLHGPKPRSEIRQWMQAADGFVLPSRNEPFGISLIEAMACGLPVISTKSGGPETILNDTWGYLVDRESSDQLAHAIEKLTAIKSFDSNTQHAYIRETFGRQRYLYEHKKLYENLLGN